MLAIDLVRVPKEWDGTLEQLKNLVENMNPGFIGMTDKQCKHYLFKLGFEQDYNFDSWKAGEARLTFRCIPVISAQDNGWEYNK